MSDYDTDILKWSEQQVELLRQLAEGEPINDNDLDWSNIIGEVADVGRTTLRACRSQLLQALLYDVTSPRPEGTELPASRPSFPGSAPSLVERAPQADPEMVLRDRHERYPTWLSPDRLDSLPDAAGLAKSQESKTLDPFLKEGGCASKWLKAEAWPLSREAPHWRSEARVARINAADAYAPSVCSKIDVQDLYTKALRAMPETIDDQLPLPMPEICPVTLDDLLSNAP